MTFGCLDLCVVGRSYYITVLVLFDMVIFVTSKVYETQQFCNIILGLIYNMCNINYMPLHVPLFTTIITLTSMLDTPQYNRTVHRLGGGGKGIID